MNPEREESLGLPPAHGEDTVRGGVRGGFAPVEVIAVFRPLCSFPETSSTEDGVYGEMGAHFPPGGLILAHPFRDDVPRAESAPRPWRFLFRVNERAASTAGSPSPWRK
jgi:hypothetical protein